jgi:hypothetical protein
VCKEWDKFLMNMWGQRGKILAKLNSNWRRGGPCNEWEVLMGMERRWEGGHDNGR